MCFSFHMLCSIASLCLSLPDALKWERKSINFRSKYTVSETNWMLFNQNCRLCISNVTKWKWVPSYRWIWFGSINACFCFKSSNNIKHLLKLFQANSINCATKRPHDLKMWLVFVLYCFPHLLAMDYLCIVKHFNSMSLKKLEGKLSIHFRPSSYFIWVKQYDAANIIHAVMMLLNYYWSSRGGHFGAKCFVFNNMHYITLSSDNLLKAWKIHCRRELVSWKMK